MIKDEVRLTIAAGKGGDGAAKFSGTKKYPTGGDGGKGGDVYIEGTVDDFDLNRYTHETKIKAEDGQIGGPNKQRGRAGNDIVIKVPLITEVYGETGNLIFSIEKHGERKLLLTGGEGGLGNYHFRGDGIENLGKFTKGKKGKDVNATLILKLKADIVFIGFPNAGKSSMLNALTNANVKVANYPFTTLAPHLGRMKGISLMDLPGLIEGTYEGKGLGPSFVKHTEKAKAVAHFISLESEDLLHDYTTMRTELEKLDPELAQKPEVIILTKTDIFDTKEEVENKISQLKKLNKKILTASIIDDESLENLRREFISIVKGSED